MPEPGQPFGVTPLPAEYKKDLIPKDVKNMGEFDLLEAANILKVHPKYLRRAALLKGEWLDLDFLKKVHKDMYSDVWRYAGEFRQRDINPGIEFYRIPEEAKKLCDDVVFWDGDKKAPIDLLERSVMLHHRLTWIHPFSNGNGRHARLIQNIYLKSHGAEPIVWPANAIRDVRSEIRRKYVDALILADRQDYSALMKFFVELVTFPPCLPRRERLH